MVLNMIRIGRIVNVYNELLIFVFTYFLIEELVSKFEFYYFR